MASDVLIVGASGAGLACAVAASRGGATVTILEAKGEIGVPEPHALVAFDFLWRAGIEPKGAEVRRRLEGAKLRSPGGRTLEVAAPLSVLDRTRFDARLADDARANGTEIITGVRRLRVSDDRRVGWEGAEAQPRVVVFADGAPSLAGRFVRSVRDPEGMTWGVANRIEAPDADARHVTLSFGSHAPGGRAQLTPIGEGWVHWTFYRGDPAEAGERARHAMRLDARLQGWDERVVEGATLIGVAPDPALALPGTLVADGLMVVGGAAGQGGVEVGIAAGELAGSVAAACVARGDTTARALGEYERRWKAEYLAGYRALRRTSRRIAKLSDDDLDRVLAPWDGWRVPVRDLVGLAHPSPIRRAEALTKFVARNPHALPRAAWTGLKAILPW